MEKETIVFKEREKKRKKERINRCDYPLTVIKWDNEMSQTMVEKEEDNIKRHGKPYLYPIIS